jgi:hypothetical protein
VECRPAQIFCSGVISDRFQIGVLQLVASPLPIACPFRIVALLKFSCLPDRFSSLPIVISVGLPRIMLVRGLCTQAARLDVGQVT